MDTGKEKEESILLSIRAEKQSIFIDNEETFILSEIEKNEKPNRNMKNIYKVM